MIDVYIQHFFKLVQTPLFSIFLGAICLLYGIYFVIKCQFRTIFLYNNPVGKVEVTLHALIHLIRVTCNTLGVSRPSIRIYRSKGKINLKIRLVLVPGHKLADLSGEIQAHLLHTMQDVLGVSNMGQIDIIVVGFHDHSSQKNAHQVSLQHEIL